MKGVVLLNVEFKGAHFIFICKNRVLISLSSYCGGNVILYYQQRVNYDIMASTKNGRYLHIFNIGLYRIKD